MRGVPSGFRKLHIGALALVAIMLPWSEFLLSNAQFLLIGNWLVEGVARKDLAARFKRAFSDRNSLIFISLFLLHVLGLLWTDDLDWGLDLCRILLPVLAFAPILASAPRLSTTQLRAVLLLGAWSTVASTLVCLIMREQVIEQGGYRELSVFISHIRLALLLCFSLAVFVVYLPQVPWLKIAHGTAVLWCLLFLDLLSSLLGILIVGVMTSYGLWRASARARLVPRWVIRGSLLLLPLIALGYLRWCMAAYQPLDPGELSRLPERSAGGETYWHDRKDPRVENGHFVWVNIASGELRRSWARRSELPFDGVGRTGERIEHTLLRYMASMGLRKDSLGMQQLTDQDIDRVEQGIPSVLQGRRDPLRSRIDQVLFEFYDHAASANPNGYSVVMRLEFLRTGWGLAKEHWLTGVGTGDTRPAFAEAYARSGSLLFERNRLRAHDQYLTWFISFGFFGMLWCFFSFLAPAVRIKAFSRPLFVCWLIIFGISCLSEDTMETQMGATFFAFPYCLLVFAAPLTSAEDPAPVVG